MKIIKKPELRSLKKSATAPHSPTEPVPQVAPSVASQPIIEQQPNINVQIPATESLSPTIPVLDYPIVQSPGNSGWQPSDIGA